ncbi:MAG: electron transport complex protein RnfB [Oleiphilaceae bacterium]|jgi:electron transport complex protein RnfB
MVILSIISIPLLATIMGLVLTLASRFFSKEADPLITAISDLLPNGQCGQCGFPGCAQAAIAMNEGELGPDCCPPGGEALAQKLSDLLGVPLEKNNEVNTLPQVVEIQITLCDGCTRCIKKCPFDAIVGANKQLHGVLSQICTGCSICVSACPQEAISYKTDPIFTDGWAWPKPKIN